MAFLEELKRRKVVRVVIAYAAAAFIVVQVADIALPALGAPDWVLATVVVIAALGLPVAAALAWAFDITPGGIARTSHPAEATPAVRRRSVLTLAGVALLGLAAAGGYWWTRRASVTDLDPGLVAVLPFRVSGDAEVMYLREGMVDLLAATLNGEAGMRAADPRSVLSAWRSMVRDERADLPPDSAERVARRLGAGRLLLGSIVASGAELRITAQLYHVGSGRRPAELSAAGGTGELHALIDRIAGQLLSLAAGVSENRLASLTTTSLPALRAYLDGQSFYRRSRFGEAGEAFGRAVAADSGFVLAALGLRMTAGWGDVDPALSGRAPRLIARHLDRLVGADAVLARALIGSTYPRPRTAAQELADWEAATVAAPARPEAWFGFGDALLHRGGLLRPDSWDAAMEGMRRTVALDSTFTPAIVHLLDDAISKRDSAAFLRYSRMIETGARGVANYQYITRAAFTNGAAALARLDTLPTDDLTWLTYVFHLYGDLVDREQVQRGLAELQRRALTTQEKRNALSLAHFTAMNRGSIAAGTAIAEELRRLAPDDPAQLTRSLAAALYWDGDAEAARAAAPRLAAMLSDSVQDVRAHCVLAQWRAAHGEPHEPLLAALDAAASDSTSAGVTAATCAALVRGIHALETRRAIPEATRRLDQVCEPGPVAAGIVMLTEANLVLARLHEASNDRAAALRAVRRRTVDPSMVTYMSTQRREEGRLAELAGERQLAIDAYTEFLRLRDPGSPGVEDVRRALGRLVAER
jgi:TolB-like protein